MNGYAYDAAGNLLSNGVTPLTWDAESRLTSAAGATYIYDAGGNRIEKQGVGVTDTIYFSGRPIARLSGGQWTDLVYGPNGLLAEVAGTQTALPTYRLLDHLGTEVGTTDASGQLINPLDYTPFGRIFAGNTNDPYLFTGKERDAESGLDNFGARYMSSTMGRFMSPDPSRLSVDFQDPQTWNRYTYVLNRPLTMVDRNGKWPTEIHNQIIDNAFPNLSNRQRQILKDISKKQDSLTGGGQGNSNAYQHAMRNSGQTVAEAKAEYDNYVANQDDMAQDAQMDWYLQEPDWPALSDEALGDFGRALHAVLDNTSPAHEGFQLWNWQSLKQDRRHVDRAATISPMQMRRAVAAARSQFNDVFNRFGFQAFQDEPVYVVTHKIIY